MGLELSGLFIIDIFLLLGLLFLPLPTTPYILYLFTANTIIEAGLIFFFATTFRDFIAYYLGYFSRIIPFNNYLTKLNLNKKNFFEKIKDKVKKFTEYAKEKLKECNTRDVIVARWLGVHPIIIAFGLGRLSSRIKLFFIPNTFYVLIDVAFYWLLFGSGKIVLNYFFPELSIEEFLNTEYIYLISVISIILFYLLYGLYKWRSNETKN